MKCSSFFISTASYTTTALRNWKESSGKESVGEIIGLRGEKNEQYCGFSVLERAKKVQNQNPAWQVIISVCDFSTFPDILGFVLNATIGLVALQEVQTEKVDLILH